MIYIIVVGMGEIYIAFDVCSIALTIELDTRNIDQWWFTSWTTVKLCR